MAERISEYFKPTELSHKDIVSSVPKNLHRQERDWTCCIACIRTLLSGFDFTPEEISIIHKYALQPSPYYSEDIKHLNLLGKYDVKYGCDYRHNISFDFILSLMEQKYGVMVECMYNYAHWLVLLGYFPLTGEGLEKSKLLVYDPYYIELRLLNTDEFIGMWLDGDHETNGIRHDFIAIRY